MYRRKYRLYLATLLFAGMALSCQKAGDPCAGLMNEGPLKQVGVIFVDKETGENLIKTYDIDASKISVTDAKTGKPYKNWDRYYHPENPSPLNGVVRLSGIPETAGDHSYRIQLDNFDSVTLVYTVSETENNSGSPCSPRYDYSITKTWIEDHPFEVFEYEHGTIPEVLVVPL